MLGPSVKLGEVEDSVQKPNVLKERGDVDKCRKGVLKKERCHLRGVIVGGKKDKDRCRREQKEGIWARRLYYIKAANTSCHWP